MSSSTDQTPFTAKELEIFAAHWQLGLQPSQGCSDSDWYLIAVENTTGVEHSIFKELETARTGKRDD